MPDAILLDWNMPVMDGFEFLRELRRMPEGGKPKVVFCTTENDVAHIARAMHRRCRRIHHEAVRQAHRAIEIRRDRIGLKNRVWPKSRSCSSNPRKRSMSGSGDARPDAAGPPPIKMGAPIAIPRVLAIGASTGGPQALSLFLGRLSPHLDNVPVLIVLHMPPDFTDVVCGHIERATGRPTHAARNSERIRPGEIYFAPGNRHLKAAKLDTTPILLHCDSAPENFCRPAVNVLFRSRSRASRRRGNDDERDVLLPRPRSLRQVPQRHPAGASCRARRGAAAAHLVRRLLDRPGTLFAGHAARRGGAAVHRLERRDFSNRSIAPCHRNRAAGLYSQFEVQRGLPITMLLRYFQRAGDKWQINEFLRSRINFREFNLLADYRPLGGFDAIFCRMCSSISMYQRSAIFWRASRAVWHPTATS
jgi:hypothetical protein